MQTICYIWGVEGGVLCPKYLRSVPFSLAKSFHLGNVAKTFPSRFVCYYPLLPDFKRGRDKHMLHNMRGQN